MQIDCTLNLFAFRPNQTCIQGEEVAPKSGLYIDDEGAISLSSMSQLGKHTYKTAQEALNSKTHLAVLDMLTELQAELMRHGYIVPQMQMPNRVGCYTAKKEAASASERGIIVKRSGSCSRFSVLYLESITFKGDATELVTVTIRKYENGTPTTILDSYTLSVPADGIATLPIDKYYNSSVAILVTAAGQPYETDKGCDCICNVTPRGYKENKLNTWGWDGTSEAKSTYGVTICAAVRCHLPSAICYLLPLLYSALYYKTIEMLLSELLAYNAPTDYTAGYVATDPLRGLKKEYSERAERARIAAVAAAVQSLRNADMYCISCAPSAPRIKSLR